MPRIQRYFPGVQKKNYIIFTANSGVGKSKLVKSLMVFNTFMFLRANPQYGMKLKTLYFCLEENRISFIHSFYCYLLYTLKNIIVPIKDLKSITNPIPDQAERYLDEFTPIMEEFEDSVAVIDDVRNPYGIYKTCLTFLESIGTYTTKNVDWFDKVTGTTESREVRDRYIENDPETYVQIVIDHIGLIHPESGSSKHEAIGHLSQDYLMPLRDKYYCAITVVQQQGADKEKQEYTYKGASIESKLEPSLDGLGIYKATHQDANEVFGLFAPDRYAMTAHCGFDISMLRDNYRSYSFLKSRDGEANLKIGLFFNGACNYFEELPATISPAMADTVYTALLIKAGRPPVQQGVISFRGIQ